MSAGETDVMEAQAADFLAECEALAGLLETFGHGNWERPTQFKQWTVNNVLVHLHFWNRAADLSVFDPDGFDAMFASFSKAMQASGMRAHENAEVVERGEELFSTWRDYAHDMAGRWSGLDPKLRVKWAGPSMSVRSSMSARQMETWAHAQEIFDLAGVKRQDADRIRNVVMLGVNAYGWSFKVHGKEPPGPMPKLALTAPSGDVWTYGEGEGNITGSAVEFCQVVTQTRNIADTSLQVEGEAARAWMANAQCFAGPPETPPAPGTRGPRN